MRAAICLCLISILTACASRAERPQATPPPVIQQQVPNTCASAVPPFQPAYGLNSDQLDAAHQAHILALNHIIECFIEITKPLPPLAAPAPAK